MGILLLETPESGVFADDLIEKVLGVDCPCGRLPHVYHEVLKFYV
jgi:hypothetical protein